MITLYNVLDTRTSQHYSVAVVYAQHAKWFVYSNGSAVTIPPVDTGGSSGDEVDHYAEILSVLLGGAV